ncbi:MAG TPA: hypothetical protein DCZ94_12970 [Lentisphaeria bacterium]|nr:MAG: hypothetical protein A2X48_06100 [Lentisphaerae bacterium GWF2_49_21]HBC87860.1 hypothetical protein [Lentisphaeria bacterium]
MTYRKHPTYNRHLINVFLGGLLFFLLFALATGYTDQKWMDWLGIILGIIFIFGFGIYAFWVTKHIRCPECSSICEYHSGNFPGGDWKAICKKCDIVWELDRLFKSFEK